eukprot:6162143-Pyramimonas_sp.AAC.1
MAGTEDTTDKYAKCVEDTFGCKLNKHTYTNCALRPIQHPDLAGADAGAQATKMVADVFVSLRGAL